MKISKWFSEVEAVVTQQVGINNSYTHNPQIAKAVKNTADQMDKVRELLGSPITVNSWYRCPELNKKIGGSKTSQHMKGEAVDFVCPAFGNPMKIVKLLEKSNIQFDQMIMEGSWVHISFKSDGSAPRKQVIYV